MPKGAHLVVLEDAAALVPTALEWLAPRIEQAVKARGVCSLALAGGGTPKKVYEALGQRAALPWDKLHFYFGDERCVPPEHEDSNYRMAREALAKGGQLRLENVHRIRAEDPDPEKAARDYESVLPKVLDLMLLGIGEDGHTASLFPGAHALREFTRRLLVVVGAKPPPRRITVTPPVIGEARELLVLAAGEGKAEAVSRAFNPNELIAAVPAKLANRPGATWLVDRVAAKALPPAHSKD
jgi:6-phosphogluconolactonase